MTRTFNLSIQIAKIPIWDKFTELHPRNTSKVLLELVQDYVERNSHE